MAARRHVAGLPGLLLALTLLAWVAIVAWGASPWGRYLDHAGEEGRGLGAAAAVSLFAAGWALMILAMMLPTAHGLLDAFGRVTRRRPRRGALQSLVVAGFVGAWLVVGYAFRVADEGVHAAVAAVGWLEARPQLVAASAFALAGAYQFSPLKARCLTACRSPRSFVLQRWGAGRAPVDALRIGLAYGWSCVGCCWALMLVMFAVGTASVAWMLGLAVAIAIEKGTAFGGHLTQPLGAALLASAALALVA
jgi:predicted metal-binding membrane protein